MKILVCFFIVLLLTGCRAQPTSPDNEINENTEGKQDETVMTEDRFSISKKFVMDFTNRNSEVLLNEYAYTAEMRSALNLERMNQIFEDVSTQFGTYKAYDENQTETTNSGYQIITYIIEYSNHNINLNIVFNDQDEIAGFNYTLNNDIFDKESDLFTTSDIAFGLDKFKINGTLTLPKDVENPPILILVHGSGPNDRNETVGANTPFADIAYALGEMGIATLRYDKRTYTYGANIDVSSFTFSEETIDDAVLAFEKAKSLGFDKVFILGHSLGGHAIPIIADQIIADGYIIAEGYVSPLQEVIVNQYTYLLSLDGTMSPEDQSSLDAIKAQAEAVSKIDYESPNGHNVLLGASEVYWKSLNQYDVLSLAKKITAPVLIINGDRDYQVTVDEFNLWRKSLEAYDNFAFKLYPGVNHLLFKGEGKPSNEEYNTRHEVDREIIEDITDFIKRH